MPWMAGGPAELLETIASTVTPLPLSTATALPPA